MICLQCGRCCSFPVGIVKPEYVDIYDPTESDFEKVKSWIMIKKEGEECPHIKWEGDKAICSVHDKEWFSDTPCGRHGQIEESITDKCRTGEWIKSKGINVREVFYG